jgi:hypothetical protein
MTILIIFWILGFIYTLWALYKEPIMQEDTEFFEHVKAIIVVSLFWPFILGSRV